MKKVQKQKVLVGLSGGVDSSVAAYLLLQKGYQVEGVFLKNWSSSAGLVKADCPWLDDRRWALRAAAFLGIPLHTLDLEKEYKSKVMKPFFAEYAKGNTPNPDVLCNEYIKFGSMFDWAMERGFDFVATGHYARSMQISNFKFQISNTSEPQISKFKTHTSYLTPHALLRSKDSLKDQTYFLYRIPKEHLPHILFPLGEMTKKQVKALAKKVGIPQADRKESMGLCFVGKVHLKDFLSQKIKSRPGQIKDLDGRVLGRHIGLENYTIGQRQGIDVAGSSPHYVVLKDLKKNILYVTSNPEDERLYVKEVKLKDCNWLSDITDYGLRITNYGFSARFRHQGELVPARIVKLGKSTAVVEFQDKQKALASGQSLVLYYKDVCLGGGIIYITTA